MDYWLNEKAFDPKFFKLNCTFSSVILCKFESWKLLFVNWIVREMEKLLRNLAIFRFSIFMMNLIYVLSQIFFHKNPVLQFCISIIIYAELEISYEIEYSNFRRYFYCESIRIDFLVRVISIFIVVEPFVQNLRKKVID